MDVAFGLILIHFGVVSSAEAGEVCPDQGNYLCYVVDPRKQSLKMYSQDGQGKRFGNIGNLKNRLRGN